MGGMRTHESLISYLRNPDPLLQQDKQALSKKAGQKLDVLKQRRVYADYKLAHVYGPQVPADIEAANQIAQVESLLSALV